MKAVMISKFYPPITDGVGDHSFNLLHYFHENNLDFKLITSTADANHQDFYTNQLAGFIHGIKLFFLLRKLKPEMILIQYVGYSFDKKGSPFWLAILLKMLDTKIVSIIHETYIRPGDGFKTKLTHWLQKRCLASLLRSSAVAFTSIDRYLEECKVFQVNTHLLRIGSNINPDLGIEIPLNDSQPYFVLWGDRNHTEALFLFKTFKEIDINDTSLKIIGKLSPNNLNKIEQFLGEYPHLNKNIYIVGILKEQEISTILKNSLGIILLENLENGQGGFTLKSGISVAAIRHGMLIFTNKGDMTDSFLKHQEHLVFLPLSRIEGVKTIKETINNPILITQIKDNLGMIAAQFKWENISKVIYEHLK